MKYEEMIDSEGNKTIIIDNEDGSYKSFPAVEDNPEYVAFLEQLSEKE